ncbi:MAG: hypothetical protein ACRDI2_06720 [Chloroflexota bacterium]
MGPVDERLERIVATQGGAPVAGELPEAIPGPPGDMVHAPHADAHRGERAGEWDRVQPLAGLGDGGGDSEGILVGHPERGVHRQRGRQAAGLAAAARAAGR